MTTVDRLFKEARGSPDKLFIGGDEAFPLAQHFHSLQRGRADEPSVPELERVIREGQFMFCAIPVKVLHS